MKTEGQSRCDNGNRLYKHSPQFPLAASCFCSLFLLPLSSYFRSLFLLPLLATARVTPLNSMLPVHRVVLGQMCYGHSLYT